MVAELLNSVECAAALDDIIESIAALPPTPAVPALSINASPALSPCDCTIQTAELVRRERGAAAHVCTRMTTPVTGAPRSAA